MLELWLARDKDGDLNLYDLEPVKHKNGYFVEGHKCGFIDSDEFPEVTWENSPQKVKIELV